MAFNILDTVKGLFTPGLISSTASALGESESGIQQALGGAIPSILAGLVGSASSTEGSSGVLQLAKQAAGSGILGNLGGFLGNDNNSLLSQGAEMLKNIFGDRAGSIASMVASFAGIKHASASSILSMAAPVSLGALGKYATDNNLDAGGLSSFLASQKTTILQALPPALATASGIANNATDGHAAHAPAAYAAHAEESTDKGLKFLLPLLLGIFAVALCIYLFKGCSGQPKEAVVTKEVSVTEPAPPPGSDAAPAAHETFKVTLPNDTIIEAYKGGIEDKLVSFLKTDYKKLGLDSLKNTWFDFDNLNFKTGSADITPESQQQVNNLAAILQAFPAVKLKIGGYTDKTGDETNNKKLSDARAKAVLAAIVKAGAGATQLTSAEGYGSSFAKYAAVAPESDRVKDRHVSVSVRP